MDAQTCLKKLQYVGTLKIVLAAVSAWGTAHKDALRPAVHFRLYRNIVCIAETATKNVL